jgi:hypothetical protein
MVTRISSSEENKEVDNRRYGSAFGLSQAFSSLLKIDVSGDRLKASEEKAGTQKSEERVHTPASLFQQLRSTLKTEKKIIVIDSTYVPSPGQIIEFTASLRRNPMIQTMNISTELVDMAVAFGDEEKADSSKNSSKRGTFRVSGGPRAGRCHQTMTARDYPGGSSPCPGTRKSIWKISWRRSARSAGTRWACRKRHSLETRRLSLP